jgi:hypothetical protein
MNGVCQFGFCSIGQHIHIPNNMQFNIIFIEGWHFIMNGFYQ